MRCLKCGVEIQPPEVFCKECLAVLAEMPVPADAVVQIPERPVSRPAKGGRKRKQVYADYIRTLRSLIRWLCVIIFLLVVLICAMAFILYRR